MPDDPQTVERRLAEIRAREQAATVGPWEWSSDPAWRLQIMPRSETADDPQGLKIHDKGWGRVGEVGLRGAGDVEVIDSDPSAGEYGQAIDPESEDAQFIAHARADIPYLLALVDALRPVADAAQDLVDAAESAGGEGPMPFSEWQALCRAVRALRGQERSER